MRIQDIAKKAGVSTATISRVFSNHPNIRPEVREQVLSVARKYGFRPRLSSRKRNVVIVIPSKLVYPIQSYTEMVTAELARELSQRDYRIEFLPQDNLDRLNGIQFCGALFVGVEDALISNWDEHFDAPLVLIDRVPDAPCRGVFSIHSDEAQGMELAINYLAKTGHKRIGCLISSMGLGNSTLREQGIIKALQNNKLPVDLTLICQVGPESTLEAVGKMLRNGVDAFFCPGGNGGIIVAYALSLYGKQIPDDVSVIASERVMVSRYCVPAQTVITQDYGTLVKSSVDVIDAYLEGREFPVATTLPYSLIIRDSVTIRA
ncbi:MAG: LacI family DNA-binding transcriptional regulator [Victivallales bacterium]|nr:LacI family DNA-binding transcriptional regulator [Victivallales bacterium]